MIHPLSFMVERIAQASKRPVKHGSHCSLRHIEHARDLAVLQTCHKFQTNHLMLALRHALEQNKQERTFFLGNNYFLRGTLPGGAGVDTCIERSGREADAGNSQ